MADLTYELKNMVKEKLKLMNIEDSIKMYNK